jgi:hypothetical protein
MTKHVLGICTAIVICGCVSTRLTHSAVIGQTQREGVITAPVCRLWEVKKQTPVIIETYTGISDIKNFI